ncbi:hypothetical protein B0H13DRAFT_2458377, partial [Mycena leptocephala]
LHISQGLSFCQSRTCLVLPPLPINLRSFLVRSHSTMFGPSLFLVKILAILTGVTHVKTDWSIVTPIPVSPASVPSLPLQGRPPQRPLILLLLAGHPPQLRLAPARVPHNSWALLPLPPRDPPHPPIPDPALPPRDAALHGYLFIVVYTLRPRVLNLAAVSPLDVLKVTTICAAVVFMTMEAVAWILRRMG